MTGRGVAVEGFRVHGQAIQCRQALLAAIACRGIAIAYIPTLQRRPPPDDSSPGRSPRTVGSAPVLRSETKRAQRIARHATRWRDHLDSAPSARAAARRARSLARQAHLVPARQRFRRASSSAPPRPAELALGAGLTRGEPRTRASSAQEPERADAPATLARVEAAGPAKCLRPAEIDGFLAGICAPRMTVRLARRTRPGPETSRAARAAPGDAAPAPYRTRIRCAGSRLCHLAQNFGCRRRVHSTDRCACARRRVDARSRRSAG